MQNSYLQHHGILGQKWGVRRYQNKDGTLTDDGKKRYERDKLDNAGKKKENRIDVSTPDPNRWVKEDMNRRKRAIDASNKVVDQLNSIEKKTRKKQEFDLSEMTDKELRDQINRKVLEQQYEKLFSEIDDKEVSKGREVVQNILSATGTVLTLTSSALGIAIAIKELKG